MYRIMIYNKKLQKEVTMKYIIDGSFLYGHIKGVQRYARQITKELDKYINSAVDLGYLKEISKKDNETKYQIHRIIKEKITLDILQDFENKLKDYVESV